MRAFRLSGKLDTEMPTRANNKMRIRRALVVSVNFINGILAIATHHYPFIILCQGSESTGKIVAI